MIDVKKIREDFPMYRKDHPLSSTGGFSYLDNAATTFKPYSVIKEADSYAYDFTANAHRGDYDLAVMVDQKYEESRKEVASFINCDPEEVSFTSGDTMGINQVVHMLSSEIKEGDEIVLSEEEHASAVLPWFRMAKAKGAVVKYAPLINNRITEDSLKSVLSSRTKAVCLATISNVMGYVLDVEKFCKLAHSVGAFYIDDGAQSVPHMAVDVRRTDVDFLLFSGHKMLAPTGIGVMYGKRKLLEKLDPLFYGGEMNGRFYKDMSMTFDDLPLKFEAGTQNIMGALGLAEAIRYIRKIGFDEIREHEIMLRNRLVEGLKKNGNVTIYNPDADSGIVTFNINNVFAQDAATYLSSKRVYVRSGQHCAKLLNDHLCTPATLRASIYFYNNEEDIDRLVENSLHAEDFLDVFFS